MSLGALSKRAKWAQGAKIHNFCYRNICARSGFSQLGVVLVYNKFRSHNLLVSQRSLNQILRISKSYIKHTI